ncbi:MAG: hypothetical protein FJ128_02300 [Deltaproteobacteria bacterium]|nr:hypothetical protein [Deltaproteobacteria bacterium]
MSRIRETVCLPFPRLALVGTVHGDPRGYGRALKLLTALAPDVVAVEISAFSVRYRERRQAQWRRLFQQSLARLPPGAEQHLALQRVAAQLALPFEYEAARDYSRDAARAWEPVDLAAAARRHLPRYALELITPANLEALLTTPDGSFPAWVAGEYARARRLLKHPPRAALPAPRKDDRRREQLMAKRLRRLVGRYQRVVHLGGWEHLAARRDGGGLAGLLSDLAPVRFLLDEADGFSWKGEGAVPDAG